MLLSEDGSTLLRVDHCDIKEDGSFDFPRSVTSIGEGAFMCCSLLEEVNILKGVTSIGTQAFAGCINLRKINIPETVTKINTQTFHKCTSLEQIKISHGLTSIGMQAFGECINLQEMIIPMGVISIHVGAFDGCTNLRRVSMPESVTSIGVNVFMNCENLQSILIDSTDENKRERIIRLIPEELKSKIVLCSKEEIQILWKQELKRITTTPHTTPLYRYFSSDLYEEAPKLPNELLVTVNRFVGGANPYYKEAFDLIQHVPLPIFKDGQNGLQNYKERIKEIVDGCISKAVEMNEERTLSL